MMKLALVTVLAMALTVVADSVAGKWTMTVDTGSSHGVTTMGLTLK